LRSYDFLIKALGIIMGVSHFLHKFRNLRVTAQNGSGFMLLTGKNHLVCIFHIMRQVMIATSPFNHLPGNEFVQKVGHTRSSAQPENRKIFKPYVG